MGIFIEMVKKVYNKKETRIKKVWFENENLYIHINFRCGVFNLPVNGKTAVFLADIWKSHKLKKNETVLKLIELK